jgi:metal-responsive CopG/Arc/MetJ family transcriptional regulator
MTKKQIGVRLPEGLYEQVFNKARKEDQTVSQIVRRFLRQYVEGCKKQEATTTTTTEKTT